MNQAPPSYSECTGSPPIYTLETREITVPWKKESDVESNTSTVSSSFLRETKSLCWSLFVTFIIVILAIPCLCLLLYLCRNVLNYDPNQNVI